MAVISSFYFPAPGAFPLPGLSSDTVFNLPLFHNCSPPLIHALIIVFSSIMFLRCLDYDDSDFLFNNRFKTNRPLFPSLNDGDGPADIGIIVRRSNLPSRFSLLVGNFIEKHGWPFVSFTLVN